MSRQTRAALVLGVLTVISLAAGLLAHARSSTLTAAAYAAARGPLGPTPDALESAGSWNAVAALAWLFAFLFGFIAIAVLVLTLRGNGYRRPYRS